MAHVHIHLEGDTCWPDLRDKQEQIIHVMDALSIAALSGGMTSGRPSVAFRIDLPGGQIVLAELSMRLFLTAADLFRVRYGREAE